MTQADDQGMVTTIRGEDGASVLGPENVPIGSQNPGAPLTDSGSLPNLKFPFAAAHNRLLPGGWAREVTMRELPVATTLAGVDMRLKATSPRTRPSWFTDWFAHTPRHVLAKNFSVPQSAFADIPAAGDIEHTRYIFNGEMPGAGQYDRRPCFHCGTR